MSDPLDSTRLILPADGQRSYEELRESFREANRQRIHDRLCEDVIILRDRNGVEVARKKTGYLTDAPPGHEHRRVDDWLREGNRPPDFTEQERAAFVIPACDGLDRELRDLARDAAALSRHEGVRYPNDNPEGTSNADDELSREDSDDGTTA